MKSLAAIRTHRWGADEERLLAQLRPVFGDDLVVVFHNRPHDLDLPVPVVDINDAWVHDNGLRLVADYGWRCGDYSYYAVRNACVGHDQYWLIEPDVWFRGDVQGFFTTCARDEADALGVHYATPWSGHQFLRGVVGRAPMQAYFPLTRLSGPAIDWLFAQRQDYSASRIRDHAFTNDEMFVFSWLASGGYSCRALEEVAPDWFARSLFSSNPDIISTVLDHPDNLGNGIWHPVRTPEDYCSVIGQRIAGLQRVRNILAPSLAQLGPDHVQLIARAFEGELTRLLPQEAQA